MPDKYDVAIVGMGPVGTAAAIFFAHAGLSVVAFERDEEVYALPRAVAFDGEIVRAFQGIGLGEEFANLLQKVRPGDRAGFANSKREWLFGQKMVDFSSNGWQPISMFDQPEVETYLRSLANLHPNITTRTGYEVTSFAEQKDMVQVHAYEISSENPIVINASYLIGCDGANSSVRRSLKSNWHDLGYNRDWLVIDIILKEGHQLGLDTLQVCDPDRISTYVATKDPYRRWEFKLNDGETWDEMLQPEKIFELIDPWTPRGTYEIRRSAVYQFHAATADCWRRGRIFIAGDAAHQTPPFLGQGMNAGMRDIINLAWKLPLVLTGMATETLLDTYQSERLPHAQDLVEWAVSIGQLMEQLAAVELAERENREPPVVPPQKKSAGYGQGRASPAMRDGGFILDQINNEGSTGYLFSQPIVRDLTGAEFKLDQQLGRGFAIVGKTTASLTFDQQSLSLIEKLNIKTTSLAGLQTVRGHFDNLFKYSDAAIIRPDRYVFGHVTESQDLNFLLLELKNKFSIC